jgi:fumarate hydratase, class II
VGTNGVYTSSDSGATWTNRSPLPGFSDYANDPHQLVSDGDPVIVYGPKPNGSGSFTFANGARAYYAGLASYNSGARQGNQAPELLAVSRSDDNGATWSGPAIAASGHGYTFNDKDSIWADRNPASPYFGRVYISWTQFRGIPGCAAPVMFAYSTDGGSTWSKPDQITAAHNCGIGGRQGTAIRSGPDGTVYLQWEDSDKSGSIQAIAASHDGGATFSKPSTIAGLTDIAAAIPGSNFRTDSFASIAVDQTSGAVYVAWSDGASGVGKMVVYKSSDGGATWSKVYTSPGSEGYRFFQGLDVAPNGRIDLGYQALTAEDPSIVGTGNAQVTAYYVGSTNGGATWSDPAAVSRSSDPAASAQNDLALQFWGDYNTLVSTDTAAWFIYTDARNGAGCSAVDAYQAGTASTRTYPRSLRRHRTGEPRPRGSPVYTRFVSKTEEQRQLWGSETMKAVANFPVSGEPIPAPVARWLGRIKGAAARVNADLGLLDADKAERIVAAAARIANGELDDQFPIDVFQTGSGTSSNMNANEVLATLAGDGVHANDDVNMGQSSNDVFPSAVHLAALDEITNDLLPALDALAVSLEAKAKEFDDVVKSGRTHWMDAVPVTLGQEFAGYAAQVRQGAARVRDTLPRLGQIPLGGTAVGTGLNTHPEFAARVRAILSKETGLTISAPADPFEAQAARDGIVEASGALKTVAVSLTKIANDIRYLGSGPRAGLAEISLPELQKGSSIMPGKVNPVIPEVVTQVAAQVIGNDTAITVGGMQGHFELNVFVPLLARNILDSVKLLASASRLFAEKCIDGIGANRETAERYAELTLSAATALNPYIGYDRATEIVKEAARSGRSLREVAREQGVEESVLDEALDYRAMAKPHE